MSPPSSGMKRNASKKPVLRSALLAGSFMLISYSEASTAKLKTGFLLRFFFSPEDGGDMFLRKVE
jgi:hypothetical protein